MKELVLRKVLIRDLIFGEKTEVVEHVLRINREDLMRYLLEDHHLQSVDIEIARPGEKKRIIPVKDVLEPRAKLGGTQTTFPGFLGTADLVGTGITCCLDGVAVVTSGKLVNFQEGLIDMVGPGAEFSLFSRKLNSLDHLLSFAWVSSSIFNNLSLFLFIVPSSFCLLGYQSFYLQRS